MKPEWRVAAKLAGMDAMSSAAKGSDAFPAPLTAYRATRQMRSVALTSPTYSPSSDFSIGHTLPKASASAVGSSTCLGKGLGKVQRCLGVEMGGSGVEHAKHTDKSYNYLQVSTSKFKKYKSNTLLS